MKKEQVNILMCKTSKWLLWCAYIWQNQVINIKLSVRLVVEKVDQLLNRYVNSSRTEIITEEQFNFY